jgi:hypothetical protein
MAILFYLFIQLMDIFIASILAVMNDAALTINVST